MMLSLRLWWPQEGRHFTDNTSQLTSYDAGLLLPLLGISFFSLVVERPYISNLHKSLTVA